MVTQDYTVKLDAFEGPLDLLLFLIKKSEVDLHNIPVATITEQYLAFVGQLPSNWRTQTARRWPPISLPRSGSTPV